MNAVTSCIEPLEDRIAPAAIFSFTDPVDNDQVKILSDKPLTVSVSSAANGNLLIVLTGTGLDGASFKTLVTRSSTGDGFVNIGKIQAANLDLGAVTVQGDLGKIECGNSNNALPALKSLNVASIGLFGNSTQGGAGDLVSTIQGDLGSLTVAGDVIGARMNVSGKLGAAKIGGDLRGTSANFSGRLQAGSMGTINIGGDVAAGAGDESGKIVTTGTLGRLRIGGSLYGAFDGTGDPAAGQIYVLKDAGAITIKGNVFGASSEQKAIDLRANAGPITIGGSILGRSGKFSGAVIVAGNAGAIRIGHDIIGSSGDFSAQIDVTGKVGGFTLGGDLKGGTGSYQDVFNLWQVHLAGSTGPVRIIGDIVGNTGSGSGNVVLGSGAPSFYLGGSLIGGGYENLSGPISFPGGSVSLGDVTTATVGGDIRESAFTGGHLLGKSVGKLLIKGSLIAAPDLADSNSGGYLVDLSSIKSGRLEGSIIGTTDPNGLTSGLRVTGDVGRLEVLGSLQGNAGSFGGSLNIGGNAGLIKIAGSLSAGSGNNSGGVFVGGRAETILIGGDVKGSTGSYNSAQVAAASFGTVTIGGDLNDSGASAGGNVRASSGGFTAINMGGSVIGGVLTAATTLGKVKVAGSLIGAVQPTLVAKSATSITIGQDATAVSGATARFFAFDQGAGAITIGGDLRGTGTSPARLCFSCAQGFADLGFTSLTVKGSVSNVFIGGGFNPFLVGVNSDATMGSITVGGNWIASSVSAGVNAGSGTNFGTNNDTAIASGTAALSRIASITIKGQVVGTPTANDHFGFVAQAIGKVKVGGISYPPVTSPIELSPIFDDVTVRIV